MHPLMPALGVTASIPCFWNAVHTWQRILEWCLIFMMAFMLTPKIPQCGGS